MCDGPYAHVYFLFRHSGESNSILASSRFLVSTLKQLIRNSFEMKGKINTPGFDHPKKTNYLNNRSYDWLTLGESIFLSLSLYLSIYLSLHIHNKHMYTYISLSLSLSLSVSLSLYIYICMYIYIYICTQQVFCKQLFRQPPAPVAPRASSPGLKYIHIYTYVYIYIYTHVV